MEDLLHAAKHERAHPDLPQRPELPAAAAGAVRKIHEGWINSTAT